MKLFYEEYTYDEILQQLVAKLPWGHNLLLKRNFKMKIASVNKKKLTAIKNLCIMDLDLEMEGYYGS